ncbi:MAG: SUF system NifU family Fe-S cluster assembly protein [SAR202 cluster bacterium]|jgi:nitrogen fixation NifU-like protein|nr:SUF system NifU family Fe-S cluster assembly protein [Chloroflexota bacterium]MCH2529304.1 SUF system NifU family Fe-S cluster assembly protein [Dehalococcoidia bacterium]MQG17594.1 SUF system NifU family Fe-S cluster assembly protein [SAR202 cluster bacterium]MQG36521.1 SUF system NifU family Fe-S cluster assembly protein [SAR202 cluster bacterium]MQG60277.1 SUF system NifU family Fe-S cluster assembly protein [SAR202 cluster bacterium]|tara:strand:+ start:17972 stop:18421 length:450 start_codon:yes stop_codon:yes gene_type:complete
MSGLNDLYQEILLEHNSKPRNFRVVEPHTHYKEGFNPLCGDRILLYMDVKDDVVVDIGFQGSGCAISRASTSMLTETIMGQKIEDINQVFEEVHKMLTEPGAELDVNLLGDLEMLSGVTDFPVRIKCAMLSWHTLKSLIDNSSEPVSTE